MPSKQLKQVQIGVVVVDPAWITHVEGNVSYHDMTVRPTLSPYRASSCKATVNVSVNPTVVQATRVRYVGKTQNGQGSFRRTSEGNTVMAALFPGLP
jgi:hypothetical protein